MPLQIRGELNILIDESKDLSSKIFKLVKFGSASKCNHLICFSWGSNACTNGISLYFWFLFYGFLNRKTNFNLYPLCMIQRKRDSKKEQKKLRKEQVTAFSLFVLLLSRLFCTELISLRNENSKMIYNPKLIQPIKYEYLKIEFFQV
jgi:hypothetical protein